MSFFDSLMKQAMGEPNESQPSGLGSLVTMAMQNPQIIAAIVSLLSSRDTKVGGAGGLGGLMDLFQQKGMGHMISSWVATGPNPPISASQLTSVLGSDTIMQFAQQAGVPSSDAASVLAGLLPSVVDQLTPEGRLPETSSLEGSLSSLLAGLAR